MDYVFFGWTMCSHCRMSLKFTIWLFYSESVRKFFESGVFALGQSGYSKRQYFFVLPYLCASWHVRPGRSSSEIFDHNDHKHVWKKNSIKWQGLKGFVKITLLARYEATWRWCEPTWQYHEPLLKFSDLRFWHYTDIIDIS